MKKFAKALIPIAAAGAGLALTREFSRRKQDRLAETVGGEVKPGFEPVGDAFVENFRKRRELGAACCVYLRGEKVVDLWGGIRDAATGAPWRADTMALVYSATKGLAAMTLALAHSRGWLDYDRLVSDYWPEFGSFGKETITVRQLLAHQAGLFSFDVPVSRELVTDPDRLADVMARQRPEWEPGLRAAYHAVTLGFYESEILRRIGPQHRTLGRFFQDEIATPLGLDFYIRLPESIPNSRLAPLVNPGILEMIVGFPPSMAIDLFSPNSMIRRSLAGSDLGHDEKTVYARELEVPSGGGVGTARAIAKAYGVFANGGAELGLKRSTLDLLEAPATPAVEGFRDEVFKGDVRFSLGFMKNSPTWKFPSERSYGSPGAGGSFGFADPDTRIGYGYVPNRKSVEFAGDARDVALRTALYSCEAVGSGDAALAP